MANLTYSKGLTALLVIDHRLFQSHGTRRLFGQILTDNRRMLRLVRKLGFRLEPVSGDTVEASLDLPGCVLEATHLRAPANQLPA